MSAMPLTLQALIEKLTKFPGVGKRSAERMAYFILNELSLDEIKALSETMLNLKQSIKFCSQCHNISEEDVCAICRDDRRDKTVICVVEEPRDVMAIEKSGSFHGLYHVLMGALSPLEGKGPDDLNVSRLIHRLGDNSVKEIIVATDSDTEGQTTALYLAKILKPEGIKLTRIGIGIPLGSNIEYTDSDTIGEALRARRDI